MGLEAALIGATLLSAGTSIYKGTLERDAAKREASALETQSTIAMQEAVEEAGRTASDYNKLRSRQLVSYLKSGVSLAGSPLLTLAETRDEGLKQAEAIRRRGGMQSFVLSSQALTRRNEGRAAMIGGIAEAGQAAIGGYSKLKRK